MLWGQISHGLIASRGGLTHSFSFRMSQRIFNFAAAASSPWDAEVTSTFLQIIKYRDRNTGQCKQIKIITELAPIWKKVGSMLGFSNNDILTFESPGSGKPFVNCLMNVFGQWLNNSVNMRNCSSYPATWRGVCNLLQDCDYGELAEMLRDAVEADFSNIRGNFNECEFGALWYAVGPKCSQDSSCSQ